MSRHIKFLKYLKKADGDIKQVNVTKKLRQLGLSDEDKAYDFLNDLDSEGYIEWTDERPIIRDPLVIGGIHDPNASLDFTAKLSLEGSDYLEERTIKINQNRGLYVSTAVAIVFGGLTIYLTYVNNERDIEIRALKQELTSKSSALYSTVADLNGKLSMATQTIQVLNREGNRFKTTNGLPSKNKPSKTNQRDSQ